MKNTLKYLKLWQKKRSEMHVDADPQADWQHMASLLDEKMPVAKTSSGFKRLKLLPSIFIAFSAAAMVYVAGNIISLEKHKHRSEHKVNHHGSFKNGSSAVDSLTTRDSTNAKDSASANIQPLANKPGTTPDSGLTKAAVNKTAINLPASTADDKTVAKTGAKQALSGNNANVLRVPNRNAALVRVNNPGVAASNRQSVINRSANGKTFYRGRRANGRSSIDHRLVQANPNARSYHSSTSNADEAVVDNNNKNALTGSMGRSQAQFNLPATTPTRRLNIPAINTVLPATLPSVTKALRLKAGSMALPAKSKKVKTPNLKNTTPSNIDWGILMGVNSSGSFTPKAQNANFYGSAPIDPYFGLFASVKLGNSWAINPQIRLFSPQTIFTIYSHPNQSKVDSNQSLTITASRKVYAVSVPIYVAYSATNNISLKLGPVVNFPVKQINANSLLQPATIKADSTYYTNITGILNKTQYDQKLNFGISGGASIKFNRFIFEATYLKSLSGYSIHSGLGSYNSHSGTFQFTIGFQLDKVKP